MFNKHDLRQKAKKIRTSLDMEDISRRIVANIRNTGIYKQAEHVMLFYPLKNEVNLLDLLRDDKTFYLPRVNGEDLDCCKYTLGDELVLSEFNVFEPVSDSISKSIIDLVFVPALCVDKNCNRLGYGKGYYDRFLSDYEGCSIIIIPEELVFSKIGTDEHDVSCSIIITQNKEKASVDRG